MYITAQDPPVSEMTYTVWSRTLNSTIPYHTCSVPPSLKWPILCQVQR